ncbi:MAG: bifunctional 2-C-methyl-D-erythritol 4-phosphate cytidylyltransferase/2-C-methyl-D-erythritol 2,4-cyclodiphosphate synthase [Campylobacterota bacterium]|nr:bifunctional 2-C-methyl-D-erythritol 4-phosphate cytidylyltransferase/2-C-methyl-D-erythritol 2,4-cyclodiphosphate synthase [Campylobacterota bacterium]
MTETTLVLLAAGNSSRFELKAKKQWLRIDDDPLWLYVTKQLSSYVLFDKIIIVTHIDELNYISNFSDDYVFVTGGSTRQESMKNALAKVTSKYVMVTDIARCCVPKEIILNLIKNKEKANCIVPTLKVSDTVIYKNETINRDEVQLIQTPQLSNSSILKNALDTDQEFTDDSGAIKSFGGTVYYTEGSIKSKKLTFGDEVSLVDCLKAPSKDHFVGQGIDIHQFEDNKPMVLGGITLDSPYGFKAHSDGDVLIHSVIDALLGACGAGDIGEFFPDTNPKYKGADSKVLLTKIVDFINNVGYEISNIDLTILAEQPKINPHKKMIKTKMAELLNIPKQKINIKATTSEKMGFIGRCEGVAVQSIATLKYYDWTKNR